MLAQGPYLFSALTHDPADVKKAWEGRIEEEKGTAWETEESFKANMELLQQSLPAKMKKAIKKIFKKLNKSGIDSLSEQDMPEGILPYIYMVLGAVGITGVLDGLLRAITSHSELESAADFSYARHQILMANALLSRK